MVMHVADFSNHQGINFKLGGYDGYILKATEGTYFVDKTCDIFVEQAKKLGKPWGVYHFLDASDVIKQAEFFVKNITGYIGKGLLVCDYEMYGRQGSAKAKQFVDKVYELTGVRCIMYMNVSDCNADNWQAFKNDYAFWIAKYSTQPPKVHNYLNVIGWQYTSTPVDKSHFYMDSVAWGKYAKSSKNVKPTEPTKPSTINNYHVSGTQFKAKENLPIKAKENFSDFTGLYIAKGQVFDIEKIINTGSSTHAKLKNNLGYVTLHKNYVDKVK